MTTGESHDLHRRGLFAAAGVLMTAALLPSAADEEIAAFAADLSSALVALPLQPIGTTSREVAAVHHGLADLLGGGLDGRQRAAATELAVRVVTVRSEVAGIAGHDAVAAASASTAARMATAAVVDPATVGTLARVRADAAIEAGRPGEALALLADGLTSCPSGPVAAALVARRAHALGMACPADTAAVEAAVEEAMQAVCALPAEQHGEVGITFDTYHPLDAADRAHSALNAAGLVGESQQYADRILPAFAESGRLGFAAYARLDRACALALRPGAPSLEESCVLAVEAAGLYGSRPSAQISAIAYRWQRAVAPYAGVREVDEAAPVVSGWRSGRPRPSVPPASHGPAAV